MKLRAVPVVVACLLLLTATGCATAPTSAPANPAPARQAAVESARSAETRSAESRSAATQHLARLVEDLRSASGDVGVTVGFLRGDEMWVDAFGHADLENDVAAKPESAYRLASVTKPMTAVGVLILADEGKVDLHTEVQEYVPYFPRKEHPITVRQLLSHLGGISHYRDYAAEGHFKEPKSTEESIAVFADFDLVADPGTRYSYTTYGYNLLGAVIEAASGQSYGDFMAERIWRPLGMESTRMDDPRDLIPHRVQGYTRVDGELKRSEYLDISSRFAGGGTRSTVPDMLRFAAGLMDGELLGEETRREVWTGQANRDGHDVGYGFGWSTDSGNGHFIVSHSGGQAETRTFLLLAPALDFAVATASNDEGADPFAYARLIYETVLDEPWSIPYFARSADDRALLRALDTAFEAGMGHHERFDGPVTTDTGELAAAFAYLRDSLSAPAAEGTERIAERIAEGVHPATDRALVTVVSHVAETLESSGHDLGEYHRRGVIPFFHDYVELYRGDGGPPASLHFEPAFEERLAGWNEAWARTWTDATRDLRIRADSDLDALDSRLASVFAGASVYPDFTGDLGRSVRDLMVAGDTEAAFATARTAADLYPDSDDALTDLAILQLLAGNQDQADALLERALEIDADGAAGAGRLNTMAYQLAGAGQPEAGLRVLQTAIRYHPDVANLYDSIGEFHDRLGNRDQAIEHYARALEIDPDYPNAATARSILERLRQEGD